MLRPILGADSQREVLKYLVTDTSYDELSVIPFWHVHTSCGLELEGGR